MKVKYLFITIVINIFVMLFTTIMLEYVNLSERFQMLEYTVQEALDASVQISTASEEMLTDKFQSYVSSWSGDADAQRNRVTYSTTLLWRDNSWHQVNSYLLANYYSMYGRLPRYASEVSACNNLGGTDKLSYIYNWLYGKVGSAYRNDTLKWANRNLTLKNVYRTKLSNQIRTPSANFKAYYNSIGKYHQTVGYLKKKTGVNTFTMELKTYPTLVNMGLELHDYNKTSSTYTHDNFTSSAHFGKSYKNMTNTMYYLTPASLGVTYVPIEVVKPVFIANLDTMARLHKISGGNGATRTSAELRDSLNSADVCIPTQVYAGLGTVSEVHSPSAYNEDIVTDGFVEYDLSSVKMKVDYFLVDFSNPSRRSQNALIVSKLEGATPYYTPAVSRLLTLDNFLSNRRDSGVYVSDSAYTAAYANVRHKRIVARVSVRIKVHVCYESSLIQWLCHKDGTNHYDIKLWNPSSGELDSASDGLWYQYTTYYCQTR